MLDKSADYLAYGLRIRSSFALPFRAAPVPDGRSRAAADVTVGVGATPPRLPNPAAKQRLGKAAWEAAPGAFLMTVDNQARYWVTDGCRILVEPLGDGDRAMEAFLVRAPFAALLQQRGLTTLHAGAVKAEAGAALFAGRKGAGKSTLLGALVERGCALLSAVFTGVEASPDGRFLALPASACLRLPADSLKALGQRPQKFEKVHEGSAKRLLPAARFCTEPTAMRAVYVLEAHQNADIEIRPVSWTQAQAELRWHTFQPVFLHGLGRQSEHFRIVNEMAAQVPVFAVRRPASPFRLDALAERIAGHLESEAAVHPAPSPPDSAAQKADSWGSTPEEAVAQPHNLVGALSGRGGLFERAEAVLRRRLAADPNDAEALLRLGDLHRCEGRLDAALDAYRRVAELRPGHPKASWLCAVLDGAELPDAPQETDFQPAPFVRVRSFLPPDEHGTLLARMLSGRQHFDEPARIGVGYVPDPRVRNNSEANRRFVAEVRPGFEPRLRKLVEVALPRLGMGGLGAYSFQPQVRTYQSGEFYAAHRDVNDAEPMARKINCVYYLHRRPKSFSGGHLLLYDDGGSAFTRIEPEDNSIVLFPSRCFHEVTTVECDPDDFGAGRFSLNGALRKLHADGC